MTKARDLADLGNKTSLDEINDAYNAGALSNRNLVINGAMQVAQRGTSATGVNVGAYNTVDRFQYAVGSNGGSGALTVSQSTEAPAGFSNSFKFEVTTTDTLTGSENILIRHRLEGQDVQRFKFGSSAAESVTISFWVKSSLTGTFGLELIAGPDANITALQAYTVSTANTWQYVSLTFAGSTNYSIPNDNARGFDVIWMLDSGPDDILDPYAFAAESFFRAPTGQVNFMATSGATFQITGVQLEVGDTATPFEHRSYGDQLAACQRYLYRLTGFSTDQTMIGAGYFYGNTTTRHIVHYPVTMRVSPSVSANGLEVLRGSNSDTAVTLGGSLDESIFSCGLNIGDVSTSDIGEACILRLSSSTSSYISFDAEV
jgi:hypothetical protein